MEIFVGTSGWSNPLWNPDGLEWYQKHSHLNAIELTMPFFHLPTPAQITSFVHEGSSLSWSVKVNRAVTHLFRFNSIAREHYWKFRELFAPLDPHISHYLFQLPPTTHPSQRDDLEDFFHETGLQSRFALEWRNPKWFVKEHIEWAEKLGITLVSADSPTIPRDIINVCDTVYLRLHGRSDWFVHHYSRKELSHIAKTIIDSRCKKLYTFLDNDVSQLRNARAFFNIIKEMTHAHIEGSS